MRNTNEPESAPAATDSAEEQLTDATREHVAVCDGYFRAVVGRFGLMQERRGALLASDGREYEVHVLPAGELERLRKHAVHMANGVASIDRLTRENAQQAALIAKIKDIISVGTPGAASAERVHLIASAFARYESEK